jgi:hypothetical protein
MSKTKLQIKSTEEAREMRLISESRKYDPISLVFVFHIRQALLLARPAALDPIPPQSVTVGLSWLHFHLA